MDNSMILKVTALTLFGITGTGMIIWMLRKDSIFGKKDNKRKFKKRNLEDVKQSSAWEKVGKLKDLWIYPVKSGGGLSFQETMMEKTGALSGRCRDRSLVIIDENRNYVNGVKVASTLLITPEFDDATSTITLNFPNLPAQKIHLAEVEKEGNVTEAKLKKRSCYGFDCGDEVADWLAKALKRKCRLVYYGLVAPEATLFSTQDDPPLQNNGDSMLYASEDTFLLMSEASITDVGKKTLQTHPPQNFRPNILVEGSIPYDEDNWAYIKIGDAIFHNTQPCGRCILTTVDFKTAGHDPKMEPLKTLRKFRCPSGSKTPNLGIYMTIDQVGRVRVGDEVFVLRD